MLKSNWNGKNDARQPCWQAEMGATALAPNHDRPNMEQVADPFPYRGRKLSDQTREICL